MLVPLMQINGCFFPGVVLSALSMFFLALPAAIFGTVSIDQDSLTEHRVKIVLKKYS